ncbi:MAG: hypothetical protein ACOYM3_23870 [Terrimicrobiaceae bacterium]
MSAPSSLPYHDTKPVGAADFYFAINATFRFIRKRLGHDSLIRYWGEMGRDYFAPVTKMWLEGGMSSVAQYWRDFFAAEPGSTVDVTQDGETVTVKVRTCPAIAHLRASGREIDPDFCQHCYFVSNAIATPAGLTMRVEGGNGACTQSFHAITANTKPQDLWRIRSCT